jgi:hypothetical protein
MFACDARITAPSLGRPRSRERPCNQMTHVSNGPKAASEKQDGDAQAFTRSRRSRQLVHAVPLALESPNRLDEARQAAPGRVFDVSFDSQLATERARDEVGVRSLFGARKVPCGGGAVGGSVERDAPRAPMGAGDCRTRRPRIQGVLVGRKLCRGRSPTTPEVRRRGGHSGHRHQEGRGAFSGRGANARSGPDVVADRGGEPRRREHETTGARSRRTSAGGVCSCARVSRAQVHARIRVGVAGRIGGGVPVRVSARAPARASNHASNRGRSSNRLLSRGGRRSLARCGSSRRGGPRKCDVPAATARSSGLVWRRCAVASGVDRQRSARSRPALR